MSRLDSSAEKHSSPGTILPVLRSVARFFPPEYRASKLGAFVKRTAVQIDNFGLSRYCTVCRSHIRRFLPFGSPRRPEARCPVCRSLERERLVWLYLTSRTTLFDARRKQLLHVAPEAELSRRIRKRNSIDYVSIDLIDPFSIMKMNITDLQFPDASFDAIICSHVLEHVEEDRRAMAQLHRVLKPGGWAIILVPVSGEKTLEDPSVTTPEERQRVFGQHDHVRFYGRDLRERLESEGFKVVVDRFARSFSPKQVRRLGLKLDDDIYFCRKAI